jgi:putative transposase
MARRRRADVAGWVYHVLNRRVGRGKLFSKPGDYAAFEAVLAEAAKRFPDVRLLAYCLMSTHWHLVLWPGRPGVLSRYMQWLTTTHMRRWHAHRGSIGTGPVYQGRFKSFPVQQDAHLLVVCRYAERNPVRAGLARRAERWRWSSAAAGRAPSERPWLVARDAWPVEAPADWLRWVNEPQTAKEEVAALAALRRSVSRGAPYGTDEWARRAAATLGLESSLRPLGRPKKKSAPKGRARNEA